MQWVKWMHTVVRISPVGSGGRGPLRLLERRDRAMRFVFEASEDSWTLVRVPVLKALPGLGSQNMRRRDSGSRMSVITALKTNW